MTVIRKHAPMYESWLQERGLRPQTIGAYLYDLRKLDEYLAKVEVRGINKVTTDIARAFLEGFRTKRKGLAERGYLRKVMVLRSFFGYLKQHEVILDNPMLEIDVRSELRAAKPNPRGMALEDVRLFIESVRSGRFLTPNQQKYHTQELAARDTAVTMLFLSSGVRLSELCGLNLGDLDLQRQQFRVIRKGGEEDFPPLHPLATEALEAYLDVRPEPKGDFRRKALQPLFVSSPPHRGRLSPDAVENLVKKYALAVDPKRFVGISPGILRHTFARMLYEQNRNVAILMEALKHKQLHTSEWYVKWQSPSGEEVRKAVLSLHIG